MVTDRNVYTEEIERHKAEIASLLTLLADARTENMRQAAELRSLRAALDILQAAMTAKKPIPLAFKKAIIDARAALETREAGVSAKPLEGK